MLNRVQNVFHYLPKAYTCACASHFLVILKKKYLKKDNWRRLNGWVFGAKHDEYFTEARYYLNVNKLYGHFRPS